MPTTIESMRNSLYTSGASTQGTGRSSAGSGSNGMGIDDFYKLLATQLKYQDADNPMDTSEMMSQMVQTQMIEAITQMSQVNTITYASSMIGKEVTMAEVDQFGMFTGEKTKGVVTGILMGDNPILFIGDKGYLMSQIMNIGTIPEKSEEGDGTQKPEGGDGTQKPEEPSTGDKQNGIA